MGILKQKTVSVGNQSQTVALKKLKNDMPRGGEFKYELVDLDTGGRIEDTFTNKQTALESFRATVEQIERGMKAEQRDSMDMGLGSTDNLLDSFDGEDIL